MKNIKPATRDTYLAMIRNSVDTNMFRNCFLEIDGQKEDSLGDGMRSCAFWLSSILTILKMIKEMHITVSGTLADIKKSGWQQVPTDNLEPGDVIVWEKSAIHGTVPTEHLGFFIGEDKAISNFSPKKSPQEHHITFGEKEGKPVRKVAEAWRYNFDSTN